MDEHILLLGGTGFIGSRTASLLCESGTTTTVVGRRIRRRLDKSTHRFVALDRSVLQQVQGRLRPLVPEKITVVDLCGYEPDQIRAVTTGLEGKISRYVYLSSVYVYRHASEFYTPGGVPQPNLPIRLDTPRLAAKPYGRGKRRCEDLLTLWHRRSGVPVSILRPSWVFGAGNTIRDREWHYIGRLRQGLPIELPNGGANRIHPVLVDDVAAVILAAATNPNRARGIEFHHVAARRPIAVIEFIQMLGATLGRRPHIVPVAEPNSSVGWRNYPLCYPVDFWFDNEQTIRTLGVHPTPWREAFQRILKA